MVHDLDLTMLSSSIIIAFPEYQHNDPPIPCDASPGLIGRSLEWVLVGALGSVNIPTNPVTEPWCLLFRRCVLRRARRPVRRYAHR